MQPVGLRRSQQPCDLTSPLVTSLGLYLFRGVDKSIDQRTLGEILVDKANRGVNVYVMVWSEKTSGDFIGEKVGNFLAML